MKVEIEDINTIEKKITVTIPEELVSSELDSVYKNLSKKAKIKGFRQGKVPRNILKRYYKDQAEEEVITKLINDSYFKTMEESNISPVSQPVIDNDGIQQGGDFIYRAKVEVAPVIEVKGYKGIELEKEIIHITKEDIDKELVVIQQSNAQLREIDPSHPTDKGDFVVIDYEGFFNGKPIEGEKVNDHLLEVGSGVFSPDFENQLLGLNNRDKKDIQITLPEEYIKKDLAGKKVTYKVEIKGIKEKVIPELNDDFAKDLGEFENLNELEKKVEERLENKMKMKTESDLREKVLDKLIKENPFEVPVSMVNQHLQYMITDTLQRLAFQGLTMEQAGVTYDSLKEMYKKQAEREIRCGFLIEEVAKQESIAVNEGEIDDRILEIADLAGQDVGNIRKYYQEKDARERLRSGILTEKTLDFIIGEAKIEEVERGEECN
ncbi:MAG: trigger factor [Thermodesulfobacteriota bacterium]|nr:trigger factor [Thermodesulfobacteriota bacterium]